MVSCLRITAENKKLTEIVLSELVQERICRYYIFPKNTRQEGFLSTALRKIAAGTTALPACHIYQSVERFLKWLEKATHQATKQLNLCYQTQHPLDLFHSDRQFT
ncbi:hypothetical protein CHARACLAT_029491 [Characodon lateralis]|uniref:Uncharacterized protein n=1 Tax=Characodon lateralis TaxID=208331 RepID=A0ABU7DBF2_9TELE|nr:hypothetical protein [Characodon lateralis]